VPDPIGLCLQSLANMATLQFGFSWRKKT